MASWSSLLSLRNASMTSLASLPSDSCRRMASFRRLGAAVVEPGAGVADPPERPGQELVLRHGDPGDVGRLEKAVVLPEPFSHLVPAQVAEQRHVDRLAVGGQARLGLRQRRRVLLVGRRVEVGRLQRCQVERITAFPHIRLLEERALGLGPRPAKRVEGRSDVPALDRRDRVELHEAADGGELGARLELGRQAGYVANQLLLPVFLDVLARVADDDGRVVQVERGDVAPHA